MSRWFSATNGTVTGLVEHTCDGKPCPNLVTFTKIVPLKSDGMVRLEGARCDGSPIHHYKRASELAS